MTNGRRAGFLSDNEGSNSGKWTYDYPAGTILKVLSQSGSGVGYLSEDSTQDRIHLKPSIVFYPSFDRYGNESAKYRLEEKLPTVIERYGPITYIPLNQEDLEKINLDILIK